NNAKAVPSLFQANFEKLASSLCSALTIPVFKSIRKIPFPFLPLASIIYAKYCPDLLKLYSLTLPKLYFFLLTKLYNNKSEPFTAPSGRGPIGEAGAPPCPSKRMATHLLSSFEKL